MLLVDFEAGVAFHGGDDFDGGVNFYGGVDFDAGGVNFDGGVDDDSGFDGCRLWPVLVFRAQAAL